jgi:hypothetical protein
MVGARLAALRDAFGKECVASQRLRTSHSRSSLAAGRYVNVIIGILSEEQAGKGLNLKDLEKLSKMVHVLPCIRPPLFTNRAVAPAGEQSMSQREEGCRPQAESRDKEGGQRRAA